MNPYFSLFLIFPLTIVALSIFKLCKSLYIRYVLYYANKINDSNIFYVRFTKQTYYDYRLEKFLNKYMCEFLKYFDELERMKLNISKELEHNNKNENISEIYPHLILYYVKKYSYENFLIKHIIENREEKNYILNKIYLLQISVEEMRTNSEIMKRKDYAKMKNFLMNCINLYDETLLM